LQSYQRLEQAEKSRNSELELSLGKRFILAVEAGVAYLEPYGIAIAAESGTDVGAVPAVVVAVDVTVAIVWAIHPDRELLVRRKDEGRSGLDGAEHGGDGCKLEDVVVLLHKVPNLGV
jgi:hypothetical protein